MNVPVWAVIVVACVVFVVYCLRTADLEGGGGHFPCPDVLRGCLVPLAAGAVTIIALLFGAWMGWWW